MRKAISLKVTLWIEGEDEPAHNFAKSTKQAVREIIAAGLQSHPELKVAIKSITEGSGGFDDEGGDHSAQNTPPAPSKTGAKP